jgi:NTP pyrophosphatase (non-canonical NTP hydrolase)
MNPKLIDRVENEIYRGQQKWGHVDINSSALLNAATEELGEVAHAINHGEGRAKVQQEVTEVMGILARIYQMNEQ